MTVFWLNKCKIAVVELLIWFTRATFKIGYWRTLRYEIKQCFQKQITTWTRDVFSLFLRVVNIHTLVIIYLQKIWYCFIFYEILRLPFWLKSSLMLHFLAFHWQSRFCVNEYIAKIYMKIICNIFFWSLWCSFASITAYFKISIFNLAHKVPQVRHLK